MISPWLLALYSVLTTYCIQKKFLYIVNNQTTHHEAHLPDNHHNTINIYCL